MDSAEKPPTGEGPTAYKALLGTGTRVEDILGRCRASQRILACPRPLLAGLSLRGAKFDLRVWKRFFSGINSVGLTPSSQIGGVSHHETKVEIRFDPTLLGWGKAEDLKARYAPLDSQETPWPLKTTVVNAALRMAVPSEFILMVSKE